MRSIVTKGCGRLVSAGRKFQASMLNFRSKNLDEEMLLVHLCFGSFGCLLDLSLLLLFYLCSPCLGLFQRRCRFFLCLGNGC